MVPCKPWTAKYMTLDPVMAQQSRRGDNSARYKDGTFRPNRPLPEGYSPRANMKEKLVLSPRYQRSGGVYEWGDTTASYQTVSLLHYPAPDAQSYSVPTRHGLSPRTMVSGVSQAIAGDGYLQFSPRSKAIAGIKLPPLGTINGTADKPPLAPADEQTPEQQLAFLELALRQERRKAGLARAQLETHLRKDPLQISAAFPCMPNLP